MRSSRGSGYGDHTPRSEDIEVLSSALSDAGSARYRELDEPTCKVSITARPDGGQTITIDLEPGLWDPTRWHTLRRGEPNPGTSRKEDNATLTGDNHQVERAEDSTQGGTSS